MIGTLIWVGDTSAAEFRGAVEYCLLNVSQLAFRRSEQEAIARPASDVRWILVAQSNRSSIDDKRLRDRYPAAKWITVRGPLCQGIGGSSRASGCDWQDWDQVLPQWLGIEPPAAPGCQSVAVVAASLSSAEPLLDLAESSGATAVWCRQGAGHQVRNVDAVWWDDSVATPVSQQRWRERIEAFSVSGKTVQHAWIANSPRMQDARAAQQAGIQWLVSKPHRIDTLLGMLAQPAASRHSYAVRAA